MPPHRADAAGAAKPRDGTLQAWSCLGLVRHLTLSDERYWFEVVVDGGERVDDNESPVSVIDAFRASIERADATSPSVR
jgi:hypothetical protein